MARYTLIGLLALLLFAPLLFGGCIQSTQPFPLTTCGFTNSSSYAFGVEGNWLVGGQQIFALDDPLNPALQPQSIFSKDTIFIDSASYYTFNNGSVTSDSILTPSYSNIGRVQQQQLSGYPRHVAHAFGFIYTLRHTSYPGGNEQCPQPVDSISAVDVDRLNDGNTYWYASIEGQVLLTDAVDLAIVGRMLYVLDAVQGLVAYDLTEPTTPALLSSSNAVKGYHLQALGANTLLVYTTNGIQQYDVSQPSSPRLVSTIE